jgi:hypothetical protein
MGAEPAGTELRAFLSGDIDAASFHHIDHVRMGFEIVRRHAVFVEAASAYSAALRAIAVRAGKPDAYHETITLAFLSLIAERVAEQTFDNFAAFIAANADLLDKNTLIRWYTPEQLQSAAARATFVLPAPRRT